MVMAPIDVRKPLPRPYEHFRVQMQFTMMDAASDGNGVLTSDEYGVGKELQGEFRRYDSNLDGKMTRDEFHRGRQLDSKREKPAAPTKGAGDTEEPSPLKKALPWLALSNPITAPLGLFGLAKKFFS